MKIKRNKTLACLSIAAFCLSGSAFAAVNLIKIGNRMITDADIKEQMSAMPKAQRQVFNRDNNAKKSLLERFIAQELFVKAGEKSGLEKTADYKKQLENVRKTILAQLYMKKQIDPKFTNARIKRFFNSKKSRYSNDEVHAYHILLKELNVANEVYKKVKAGGDFKVLAKKHSKDPSAAQNQGDLGFFTRARMVPEFAAAAFSMKKGQVSKPVKTPFGYHIIKVVNKKRGKKVVFKDVEFRVKRDFRQQLMADLLTKLKKSNSVKVYEENLGKLSL